MIKNIISKLFNSNKRDVIKYYKSSLQDKYFNKSALYHFYYSENFENLDKDARIKFKNLDFGSPQTLIINTLGKPQIKVINNKSISDHIIFMYLFNNGGIKSRCEIHFYKDSFFAAVNIFDGISKKIKAELLKALGNKYNFSNQRHKDSSFIDSNSNILKTKNDVELAIYYIYNSENSDYNFKEFFLQSENKEDDFSYLDDII